MSPSPSVGAEKVTAPGKDDYAKKPSNIRGHRKSRKAEHHVRFSTSTVVRMIENPDSFDVKFRAFKRALLRALPCFKVKISPFKEYTTETEFEEKKGDLARVGMPPNKRASIGEIDLTNLKAQLEKFQQINAKLIHVAEADEKFHAEELKSVHRF